MSRDYECYCHRCKQSKARSDFLDSGYHLFQCQNCGMYWQGEGCICEIETGIICKGMTKDFVPQCKLSDDDLVDLVEENE
jgi:hypothetical protein